MNKYDYVENIYCDSLDDNIKGFFDRDNCDILKNNSTNQVILSGMEFRPDKVATYYLGSANYSWLIDLANDFENGIKDYTLGRKILVPKIDVIYTLLSKE